MTLEEENESLRKQLMDVSSLYKQLVTEGKQENFEERRVNLLKSQLIQFQRQVLLLSEALGSRSATLLEVENGLSDVADRCRNCLRNEQKLGEVTVSRDEMKKIVDTVESSRIKLFKNIENTAIQNLQRPLVMMDHFVRHQHDNPITLMDVCSGSLQHINLKHVAKLESRLSQLYKHCKALAQTLSVVMSRDQKAANQELPSAVYVRMATEVTRVCEFLEDAASDLLVLTVLVPAAPWPSLQKPPLLELTVDNVMARLPNFPRSKVTDARNSVDALLKAMSYSVHMNAIENDLLKAEITFHKEVYQLQMDYVNDLWQANREGYISFEENVNEMICRPLTEILKAYNILQSTAAEEALRNFLSVFKCNAHQLSEAVQKLNQQNDKEREAALSEFGTQFLTSMEHVRSECRHKRDKLVKEMNAAKQQQNTELPPIRNLFGKPHEESKTDTPLKMAANSEVIPNERRSDDVHIEGGSVSGSGADLEHISCSCGAETPTEETPSRHKLATPSGNKRLQRADGKTAVNSSGKLRTPVNQKGVPQARLSLVKKAASYSEFKSPNVTLGKTPKHSQQAVDMKLREEGWDSSPVVNDIG